jgi:hypothetical protein
MHSIPLLIGLNKENTILPDIVPTSSASFYSDGSDSSDSLNTEILEKWNLHNSIFPSSSVDVIDNEFPSDGNSSLGSAMKIIQNTNNAHVPDIDEELPEELSTSRCTLEKLQILLQEHVNTAKRIEHILKNHLRNCDNTISMSKKLFKERLQKDNCQIYTTSDNEKKIMCYI